MQRALGSVEYYSQMGVDVGNEQGAHRSSVFGDAGCFEYRV